MKLPTVMGNRFSEVPRAEIQRSVFDRSFGYKTTLDSDYLVPFYVDEALPGDTFQGHTTGFMRLLSPLKVPIMDNVYVDIHFWAVPVRLVWDNFVKFMGERKNPADSVSFLVPQMGAAGGIGIMSLADYMGIPFNAGTVLFNSLHFRAYNLIYNEFYRDQNLINSVVVDVDDGPDTYGDYVLLKRGKRHDYFTSCLPSPQKGTAVSLPLGTTAPISYNGVDAGTVGAARSVAPTSANTMLTVVGGTVVSDSTSGAGAGVLFADLSTATAATINQLRQAMATQRLLERDSRGGTRYTEIIRSHFGVTSPDARLQRPEYLGGGSSVLMVSEVAQTTYQGTPTNLDAKGALAATGRSGFNASFTKSFTEHTLLLGIVSVRADLTYQQGLDRMWSRQTRLDYYWGALSHIGEQSVPTKEIFSVGAAGDDVVFGYQERYAEYRYKPSKITGLLRSDFAGTLHYWHLSQDFAAAPTLNQAFMDEAVPLDRVIAVPAEPHFVMDSYTSLKCARPMPLYGVPGFMDRF